MKLKLTPEGHAIVKDGKPVYIHDDGTEVAFDAPGTVATITRLNGEAKGNRERYEAAEAKYKPFEGIDHDAARKAIDGQKNWDEKQRMAAGERDKAVAEAVKAIEEKYAPIVKKAGDLEGALHAEKIGGSFARSKLIAEKFAIPADLVQARFGSAFGLEEGKIVAKDAAGNKLYSKSSPGNLADFDEALEMLVDQYAYKAQILKGSGASGGGAVGGNTTGAGGKQSLTRSQFDAMDPGAQRSALKAGATLTD